MPLIEMYAHFAVGQVLLRPRAGCRILRRWRAGSAGCLRIRPSFTVVFAGPPDQGGGLVDRLAFQRGAVDRHDHVHRVDAGCLAGNRDRLTTASSQPLPNRRAALGGLGIERLELDLYTDSLARPPTLSKRVLEVGSGPGSTIHGSFRLSIMPLMAACTS